VKVLSTALRPHSDIVIRAHLYPGPLAVMIPRLMGARLVTQLHGTEVWTRLAQDHVLALEMSDLFLCVSRDTRARVRSHAHLTGERVRLVPNTVPEVSTPGEPAAICAAARVLEIG
jgi:phosphatidylinositol alpha-1,6-mannosyltransferase